MFGSHDINSQIKTITNNIFNMVIFEKFKTGNTITDTMITTLLLMFITYGLQFINDNLKGKPSANQILGSALDLGKKKLNNL